MWIGTSFLTSGSLGRYVVALPAGVVIWLIVLSGVFCDGLCLLLGLSDLCTIPF